VPPFGFYRKPRAGRRPCDASTRRRLPSGFAAEAYDLDLPTKAVSTLADRGSVGKSEWGATIDSGILLPEFVSSEIPITTTRGSSFKVVRNVPHSQSKVHNETLPLARRVSKKIDSLSNN
jgi:hypothetical protein